MGEVNMKILMNVIAVAVMVGVLGLVNPQEQQASKKEIKELIEKLGSDSKTRADEAQKKLEEIGKPAIPYLVKAIKKACKEEEEFDLSSRLGDILLKNYILESPLKDAKVGEWTKYRFKLKLLHAGMPSAEIDAEVKMSITKRSDRNVEVTIEPEKVNKNTPGVVAACCGRTDSNFSKKTVKKEVDISDYIHTQMKKLEMLYNGPMKIEFAEPKSISKSAGYQEITVAGKKWDCVKVKIISNHACAAGVCPSNNSVERTYWFNKDLPVMGVVKMKIDISFERGLCQAECSSEIVSYGTEKKEK
jgi:hypothetical protein